MKNFFLSMLVAAAMVPAIASADCSITNCDNGPDPMSLSMSWGLTGYQTPVIPSGSSVTDRFGNTYLCPAWFPAGCFDLTNTAWYLSQFSK